MSSYNTGASDGYPMVDIDSDDEKALSSSDDDINVILHGTPEQKRRLRRKSLGQDSSSEDEFEKEMDAELNATMKKFEAAQRLGDNSTIQSASSSEPQMEDTGQEQKYYAEEYFDSDEEAGNGSNIEKKRKHPVVSNDDLFYDPGMDDDDQKWVDSQRRKYQPKVKKTTKSKGPKALPHSDAVLNCPACMTLLCLDCQRHSLYNNQYRAMFVQNCGVDNTEVLKYPKLSDKSKKTKKKKLGDMSTASKASDCGEDGMAEQAKNSTNLVAPSDDQEIYHPVRCTICTTEVGVFDNDEIYHFFNVLASHS